MIKVYEGWPFESGTESGTTGQDTRSLLYFVTGTGDYVAARAAFEAEFNLTYDGLELKDYKLKQIGAQLWRVVTNYSQLITQSHRYTVDTTGHSIRITHGFAERRYGPTGLNDPNVPPQEGALNVQDGRVEGYDAVIPGMNLSLIYQFPRAIVDDAYVHTLENLTGTVNQAAFANRGAETLLFLGGRITQPASGDAECEYMFRSGRHMTGLTIGSITGIEKKAHEYLWPLWGTTEDTTAKRLRKVIRGVYVDQVAQVASWANFFPS